MGVKALDSRKLLDDRKRLSNGFLVQSDDAGPPLELVGAESGKRATGPAGRQRVAGACEKVSDRDRRVVSEIDRARGSDQGQPTVFIRSDQRKMFRRKSVRECHPICKRFQVKQEILQ